jgi:flagellar basal-body rod protein FlgC
MYGALDISASGLIAQRTRLASIAANMANINSIQDAQGNYSPYQRREVFLAPGDPGSPSALGRSLGVHVASIRANPDAIRPKWDPTNPFADADGMVMVPDINPATEQINALEASRAYEANIVAAEATKTMMAQALRLLA